MGGFTAAANRVGKRENQGVFSPDVGCKLELLLCPAHLFSFGKVTLNTIVQ